MLKATISATVRATLRAVLGAMLRATYRATHRATLGAMVTLTNDVTDTGAGFQKQLHPGVPHLGHWREGYMRLPIGLQHIRTNCMTLPYTH